VKKAKISAVKKKKKASEGGGFPVVGIGASAGGLEAFTQLLTALPVDTGMAFVLIQHLDPKHESLSVEILSRVTRMPVEEVKEGTRLCPNHIYFIPPGYSMGVLNSVLHLKSRAETRGLHLVIDEFFESLALDQKNLAIGVILSGTASDGTQGLMAIKAEGGITLAQSPKSSKFDGMPQSAISSGSVDLVLTPEQIARELAKIAHHPYAVPAEVEAPEPPKKAEPAKAEDSLMQIFLLLRNHCHLDFSLYKPNTIRRRLERRMVLRQMNDLKAYAEYLSKNPDEVNALYADILIHVTGFFRDAEAYQALKATVFPKLMENRSPGVPIRIWVAGCSTGEEAYSIAICLVEFLGAKAAHTPIQIFASDISERAIQKARLAEYPDSITAAVSEGRLSKFFTKMDGGGYKISKAIRDICLFSRHDVTRDPPFAKIDLLSCRNVLIYFTAALQKHVLPIFHYALSRQGFLWLGKSETIGAAAELFSPADKNEKIYSKRDVPVAMSLRFPSSTYVQGNQGSGVTREVPKKSGADIQSLTDVTLQSEYPGVLINEDMGIVQLRGRTSPFIEPAPGVPSFHLLKMAHPELLRDLKLTLQAAKKSGTSVRKEGLSLQEGLTRRRFNLNVIPVVQGPLVKERFYLILFENVVATKPSKNTKIKVPSKKIGKIPKRGEKKDQVIHELHQELIATQEYQQSLNEKFDAAQEDLTTANEELQSTNEELQSTNEELETAKEELQSGNEELTTVNDELQSRSTEQIQSNNDLINLLGSVEIPIVMLDNEHKVRRFTPLAGKALNLIPTDVGRPLSDLKLNFTTPGAELDLKQMVTDSIETLISQEVEVQDRQGRWFRLQVRPYKTIDQRIDGAVLALVDIDNLKESLREVKAARGEAEKANRAKDLFLATLSHELRTPLTAILSWAQMLRTGKLDAEKLKRGLEIIETSGLAQAQLINDLLDVSRIISGKLPLDTREVDLASVVQAAVEAVRPTAELKSIQIETYFAPQMGTVMADPVRLQQVFWNLLTNAVKFSAPESRITVRMDHIDEKNGALAKAMIQVTDSGKGISADFLPQIFERFSQEDSSSIRLHGGLGLGLAIVRNLVELHGGTIEAESQGDGQGATFTVLLPIQSPYSISKLKSMQVAPLKNLIKVDGAAILLQGVRVLLVDDELNARDAFGDLLESFGAEIRTAGSVLEALKYFKEFKPHVIASDIAMPGEDGYSLIRKIRALSRAEGGEVPALAMTAYAGAEDIKLALQAGFSTHLAKPVDGLKLAKTIAKLAGKLPASV
jgi:two-component system CheB/CheR fusion protein